MISGNSTGSFGLGIPHQTVGVATHFGEGCYHVSGEGYTYTYGDGTVLEMMDDEENGAGVYVYDRSEDKEQQYTPEPHYESSYVPGYAEFCQKYPNIETIGSHACSEYL